MSTGKLKWYNAAKGFGFIVPDEGGNDVFVHVSAFKEANITKVDQGQAMEFVVAEHKGKLKWYNSAKVFGFIVPD